MTNWDKLAGEYRKNALAMSNHQKALAEREVWKALGPSGQKAVGGGAEARHTWMAKVLGGKMSWYQTRHIMLSVGPCLQPLWDRLANNEATLSVAKKLLLATKKLAKESKISISNALAKILGDYDKLDIVYNSTGSGYRRRNLNQRDLDYEESAVTRTPKSFWNHIRKETRSFIRQQLKGADPFYAHELSEEFVQELNVLLRSLQGKLQRGRDRQKNNELLSFNQIEAACATLSMDPPESGQAVDMNLARKQQRKLAKLYHPDSNGGNESLRPQYQAVIESFELLGEYSRALGTTKPELSVIEGGRA